MPTPHEKIPVLDSITSHTVDGAHYVLVTDTQGRVHRFACAMAASDLITALTGASAGIELTPADRTDMANRVWAAIEQAAADQSIVLFDPEDPATAGSVDFDEVTSIHVGSDEWDNGRFPSGYITCFRDGAELTVAAVGAAEQFLVIPEIEQGDLATELSELGGPFQGSSEWELVLHRPLTSSAPTRQ